MGHACVFQPPVQPVRPARARAPAQAAPPPPERELASCSTLQTCSTAPPNRTRHTPSSARHSSTDTKQPLAQHLTSPAHDIFKPPDRPRSDPPAPAVFPSHSRRPPDQQPPLLAATLPLARLSCLPHLARTACRQVASTPASARFRSPCRRPRPRRPSQLLRAATAPVGLGKRPASTP
jgi:hypothetical protein